MAENARNATVPRREWLQLLVPAAGGLLVLRDETGCAYYSGEGGAAYAPWGSRSTTRPSTRLAVLPFELVVRARIGALGW